MRPILSCDTQNEITNLSNWCNPEFDKMMNRALTTNHLYERSKAYNNAQDLILNELPIVPIANVKRLLVARGNVKGIEMTPFGSIIFSTLYFMRRIRRKIVLISAIRHVIWVSILLLILSVLSFVILMRDPLNAELITNNIYSAYYHYLTSLLQGDLGITYNGGESLKDLILRYYHPH